MKRTLNHLRANIVAYLALFVALGGTSYAALRLPNGSVGAAQLKNHTIQPVKLDRNYIDGSVRLWASVDAVGKVVAGGAGMKVTPQGDLPGDYIVDPSHGSKIATPRGCTVVASVNDNSATPGYAMGEIGSFTKGPAWTVVIQTRSDDGQPVDLPFDFVVIC